ncbi:MAG: helix-turn-helix domain-containing protein, partial [Candidatus Sericytochromatia bacterium]
ILEEIWDRHDSFSHAIDSNVRSLIRKLRAKIEPNPAEPVYLVTAKSNGYIFYPSGRPDPV